MPAIRRFTLIIWAALTPCAMAFIAPGVASAQFSLVSTASDGTPANGTSGPSVAISADGRYVAFASAATNLVAGDTNGSVDVFVKDRETGAIARVSVASDGTERAGDSGLERIAMSADAQVVVFSSRAAFVADDTNTCAPPAASGTGPSCPDVYVHDRSTGQTTRVSVGGMNTQADDASRQPVVSANGRSIAFASVATNLVTGDTNGVSDVFLRDRVAQTTTRLSVSTAGVQGDAASDRPSISDDGQIVAFISASTTLTTVPQPNACPATAVCRDAWARDRTAGTTTRLGTGGRGFTVPIGSSGIVGVVDVGISGDGRTVATAFFSHPTRMTLQVVTVLNDLTAGTSEFFEISGVDFSGVALNHDGRYVTSGGASGSAAPFRTTDRRTLTMLLSSSVPPAVSGSVSAGANLAPSATGRFIAFAGFVSDSGPQTHVFIFDTDVDGDSMFTAWETAFGLTPTDASDAALDPDGDGLTNVQEDAAASHPNGTFVRYFAEGAQNAFFSTYFALLNPGTANAHVLLRYVGTEGQQRGRALTIAAQRAGSATGSVELNNFSTMIESDQPIVADRVMGWGAPRAGSHGETAIEAPSKTWYLAEGATHGGFDLFYLLQNPTDAAAQVNIEYQRPAPAAPIVRAYTVGAHSRRTIWVDTEGPELEATDVSAAITSDQPIIVERAMYLSRPGESFVAGHDGAGVTAPSTSWFLAEGATGQFFDMYVLIANPGNGDAALSVSYLRPSGAPIVKTYTVPAHSRRTLYVADEDPALADTPVSVIVTSTNAQPVIVERSMWWPHPTWDEGHLSVGATATATRWGLAGFRLSFNESTYVLIANTSNAAGSATVRLYPTFGDPVEQIITLPPNSRTNVPLDDVFGPTTAGFNFGVIVESSGVPIVVERATYGTEYLSTVPWTTGFASLATRLP